MLWQTLFWEVSGGPCAPGGAFVQPINEERRMAVSELWLASSGLCFWPARASWSYVLAGPGFLETMLWQALFWELSGGPCACGGAFVGPINEERRMAVLGLCPASSGLCFWLARASWSYVLAGPGFLETMLWQALFWVVSGGPCACGGAFVGPINEERRMAVLGLCPASMGYAFGWPGLLGAMFWLGRASLKPCSGKLCFGWFRGALVHVEALSSDQLMKREGWLCWSSVRPGPGFLELWSRYGLAMVWLGRASWSYVLAGPGLLETMLWQTLFWEVSGWPLCTWRRFRPTN